MTDSDAVLSHKGSQCLPELGAVEKAVIQAASCLFPVPQGITSLFSPLSKTIRNRGTLISQPQVLFGFRQIKFDSLSLEEGSGQVRSLKALSAVGIFVYVCQEDLHFPLKA